ncbi:hypothetical protein FB567DRAFT_196317 [Paraphoma chrysanthemicola]|uniref:Uncharacterized protein n=1 Tax=Paraphoma chrysanthemicola TaxID=798071 RepID=A0A8K0VTW7_9PLEO|nr:hypothetical protein FB567DRAFT_196317 [Paraphoma chrysanthemicola]
MRSTRSQCEIGSIQWLPARDKVPLEHLYATVHIDSGCFNHPVVVLWVNPQETEAIILLVTSFGGTDLLLKHSHNTRARSLHLPIYPSNPHPDNGSLLFLKDDARMHRNSYVKIEHQLNIKTVLLRPLHHQACTLRKDSYKELVRHIACHIPATKPKRMTHRKRNTSRNHQEWPELVNSAARGPVNPPEWRSIHATPNLQFRTFTQPTDRTYATSTTCPVCFISYTTISHPRLSFTDIQRVLRNWCRNAFRRGGRYCVDIVAPGKPLVTREVDVDTP